MVTRTSSKAGGYSKRDLALIKEGMLAWKDYVDGKTAEPKGFTTYRVLLPPKPIEFKGFRKRLKLTQEGLARLLNAGTFAVRSWEQGRRTPDGPVTLLFRLLQDDPNIVKAAQKTMGLLKA
jgi:DNA-binding transcriptional regulator YiaG